MKVGIVGLGKLGFPVAVAMALRGHEVRGYDIDPDRMKHEVGPWREAGPDGVDPIDAVVEETRGKIRFCDMRELVRESDLVFFAVQTPSDPRWDGARPIDGIGADFSYAWLEQSVKTAAECVDGPATFVVISTVLPGTMRNRIAPLVPDGVSLLYNPYFIAMGTVIRDFLHPEFQLVGYGDELPPATLDLRSLYSTTSPSAPVIYGSWETIETAKMAYNTFIGLKIIFANNVMEMCDKIPHADCDAVSRILESATDRLISPKYLRGGMGDGGACHPRDQAALSWLAGNLGVPNVFRDVIRVREEQAFALVVRMLSASERTGLPMAILGTAFKAGTNIEFGSCALLCWELLGGQDKWAKRWDPYMGRNDEGVFDGPHVYLIGCNHAEVIEKAQELPVGSVVIDPWRQVGECRGVEVHRIGEAGRGS